MVYKFYFELQSGFIDSIESYNYDEIFDLYSSYFSDPSIKRVSHIFEEEEADL